MWPEVALMVHTDRDSSIPATNSSSSLNSNISDGPEPASTQTDAEHGARKRRCACGRVLTLACESTGPGAQERIHAFSLLLTLACESAGPGAQERIHGPPCTRRTSKDADTLASRVRLNATPSRCIARVTSGSLQGPAHQHIHRHCLCTRLLATARHAAPSRYRAPSAHLCCGTPAGRTVTEKGSDVGRPSALCIWSSSAFWDRGWTAIAG